MADTQTPEHSFEVLKTNTLKAIQSYFPYEGRKQRLVVENLRVDDHLSSDDIGSQSDAKDKEGTWGCPIKADVKLIDVATGKVIDTKKGTTLARLPKLTNRYGYIVGGNEYQVDHLFRLKSGAYTRVQDNGDLETEYNMKKGINGRGFSVKLDRLKKTFDLKLENTHVPLYPVLKSMGVSDDQLQEQWGKEIFEANKPKNDARFHSALKKFWDKTSEEGAAAPTDSAALAQHVINIFDQTAIHPDSTKITLGQSFHKVDGQALALGAMKVLGVSRGTLKPDDRDSLAFKEVASIEDFIPEKIERNAKSIKGRLRSMVENKKTISEILSPDLFNKPIREFFSKGGGVCERSDQTNPLQMLSANRKTTLMAKDFGGIKSDQTLTPEMKVVNASHFGFLDPMHTPESEKTGITLHLAANVRKVGKDLEAPVFNTHTGKEEYLKVADFHSAMAVLPDQVKWVGGKPVPISHDVKVKLPNGEIAVRPYKDAQYVMPSSKGLFNYASNMVPFLPCNNGNRVSMADKQMEQAIGLKHREEPLVQTKTDSLDPEHTFEKLVGHFTTARSPVEGKVISIKDGMIHVQGKDGKTEVHLYNHFPTNDPKGMLHSTPLVQVGDAVKKGQVLADSNYTKNGTLATGTNLRVGYVPYKGYNFEDGIVISESAAKKLTSEHLYKKNVEIDPDSDHISKDKFRAYSPVKASAMTKEQWDSIDDDGVIKPGTRVLPGQIMVAAIGKNVATKLTHSWGALGKRAIKPYKDKSLVWDEDHVGVVTKVVKESGGRGVKVYVKTEESALIGDKMSGRHGNKGIITQILPDHEMPFTTDEKGERQPLQVLLNPSGVPTRMNVGQLLETAAAKIAEKTGKPYIVNNFAGPGHDYRQQVLDDLKKHGLKDEEHVFDPNDPKRSIGSVLVGHQYMLKMVQQVEKKLTARGGGTDVQGKALAYDSDMQPTKGGERGGQGFGQLEMYSLLGHDARHNIREMATYKSDMQDANFWSMVQNGKEPPPPVPSFAYNKFVAMLRGAGLNVTKEGTGVRLVPMTNKEILHQAGNGHNQISDASKTLLSKNLKPVPGGLFDPYLTGGIGGDKWSYMKLSEPVPNPMFCGENVKPGPVPVLLGLKIQELDEVMHGKRTIDGKTGGHAVEAALKKVDVDKEITKLRTDLPSLKGSTLDRSNKKLKYLLALKDQGLKPHEAYMMHNIPILPPKFRPATATPSGDVSYAPINGLYKNISLINDELKNFDSKTYSEEHKEPLRLQLWDSVKALQAVGNYKPVYDMDQKGARALPGILDIIGHGGIEGQPKEGYFQSKLVKRKLDLSMRSTIVPEPNLHIDEMGVPKGAAMESYKPFVVAQLHRWGQTALAAQDEIKRDTPLATKALEKVFEDRPILIKRDPALHKFSVMGFRPKLVSGKAIQIHPLVCGGFNADFDGDTMAATIPLSKAAVEEAKKMFPSKNLFNPGSGRVMYVLDQEQILGLHYMTQWGKQTDKKFGTIDEVKKALSKHEIEPTDIISLKDAQKPTTAGRLMFAATLPSGFSENKDILHNPKLDITKKFLADNIATNLAKNHVNHYATAIDGLKDLGNEWSYKLGVSFGLKDFAVLPERDAILKDATKDAAHATKTLKPGTELDKRLIEIYSKATDKIDAAAKSSLGRSDNRLGRMVFTGARGKSEQLRQMIAAPMLVQDGLNRTLTTPVMRSFSEGLDLGEYWLTQSGARKGTLQRSSGTRDPGAASKEILNSTMSTLITSNDCKTTQGILLDVSHPDIHDRFLAAPYKLKDGVTVREGTLLTPEITGKLRDQKVLVRSPLKCQHGDGICAKCFGLNERGVPHDVGTSIGVLAGQSLGERATQLSMNAFHTGGVASGAGSESVDMFTRLKQILGMPKKLKNQATISQSSGKITQVSKDAAGGVNITINGIGHKVDTALVNPKMVVGTEVRKGEALSGGHINPLHLLSVTKDIHAVQNYMTNELDTLYNKEGVRRRNVEVVVRALTNLTKVKDPGHSDFIHGDVAPRSVVEEYNRTLSKGHRPIEHEPILKGITEIPSQSSNWLGRLNFQELHSTVQQAAAMGLKSDLHGSHPIPGMARGSEFGLPPPELKAKKPYVY
jgi:DNA-directed RNA polymerase subunit beta'